MLPSFKHRRHIVARATMPTLSAADLRYGLSVMFSLRTRIASVLVPNGTLEKRQVNLCSFDGALCHDGHALLSESALESEAPNALGRNCPCFCFGCGKIG